MIAHSLTYPVQNKIEKVEPQERAYEPFKAMVSSHPILRLPDIMQPFVLRTDAETIHCKLDKQ